MDSLWRRLCAHGKYFERISSLLLFRRPSHTIHEKISSIFQRPQHFRESEMASRTHSYQGRIWTGLAGQCKLVRFSKERKICKSNICMILLLVFFFTKILIYKLLRMLFQCRRRYWNLIEGYMTNLRIKATWRLSRWFPLSKYWQASAGILSRIMGGSLRSWRLFGGFPARGNVQCEARAGKN